MKQGALLRNSIRLGVEIKQLKKTQQSIDSRKVLLDPEKLRTVCVLSAATLLVVVLQPYVALVTVFLGFGGFMYTNSTHKSANVKLLETKQAITAINRKIVEEDGKIRQDIVQLQHETARQLGEAQLKVQDTCSQLFIETQKATHMEVTKARTEIEKARIDSEGQIRNLKENAATERHRLDNVTKQQQAKNDADVRLKEVESEVDKQATLAEVEKSRQEVEKERIAAQKEVDVDKCKADSKAAIVKSATDALKDCNGKGQRVRINLAGVLANSE